MTQEKLDQAHYIQSKIQRIENGIEMQKIALAKCDRREKYFGVYIEDEKFMLNSELRSELLHLVNRSIKLDEADLAQLKAQFEQM